ncbi:imidazolonepropionase [uncultured Tistrella sp.]|uniref:imidazolonepropionase n=1 Tax=Tistrella mobilis TaxID=171437 RepID=UPI000C0AE58A|nr:imidazolonepropionase [uncultured Tistrella sp.]MAM73865.1 imidazolonepropionase [Tistrella sp.]
MTTATRWDRIWVNLHVATMVPGDEPYGAIGDAAVAVKDGRIAWVGPAQDLPGLPAMLATEVIDAGGAWMTPGLIDCHTHLVHGGNRAREFELRLNGASYEEIAKAGGGILSTVTATRAADQDRLVADALPRLDALLAEGVTTVEVKSGYGLETDTELRMLRAARALGRLRPVEIRTTLLGAHALPPEFADDAEAYVDLVVREMIPAAAEAGLADAVDAFCERIAFSTAQTRRVFDAARAAGLPVKLHAEQLSDQKGAVLAAEFGALSADHLEYLGTDGVRAMAAAGTVAVLLPGAFYMLREKQLPPILELRSAGVPIAISTDCNPGTSPVTSLLLMVNMACTLFRLTPEEALAGVTRVAARALGLEDRGTIAPGLRADLALWRIGTPAELAYMVGFNPCIQVVRDGRPRDPRMGFAGEAAA